jgi:single-stranded-DNA-specific exonuclease
MTDTTPIEFCNSVSVAGREWIVRGLADATPPEGVHELAARIAAARGFDVERYFNPMLKVEMPDPSRFVGMDECVRQFCDAVAKGRKIALYGDYDVDGATSTALVLRWIRAVGGDAVYYIPARLKEGYGPNSAAIRKLQADEGVEFIVFLDSGTVSHEPLATAVEIGVNCIVIDHHEPDGTAIPFPLVNPKQDGEDRKFDYLCTAGLAFLFLVAVQREMQERDFFSETRPKVDLMQWLGIVALGTVADVVPLVGLNRAYVAKGLAMMPAIPGLRALNTVNGDVGYTEETCGWKFGPNINAAGRIGDTRTGTHLLSTDDQDEADDIARLLFETNEERKAIERTAVDEAMEGLSLRENDPVAVVAGDDWHPGVVGLVAGRIKERLQRPAVAIGFNGAGSCRTVPGFNIGKAIHAAFAAGLLVKGGGHEMAAGLTLPTVEVLADDGETKIRKIDLEKLEALRTFLCERAKDFRQPAVELDVALKCGELSPAMVEAFEKMAPFDQKDNQKPLVVVHGGWVKRVQIKSGRHVFVHLAGEFGETEAVLWGGIGTPLGDALAASDDMLVDLYGTAEINAYGGKRRGRIRIVDAMISRASAQDAA